VATKQKQVEGWPKLTTEMTAEDFAAVIRDRRQTAADLEKAVAEFMDPACGPVLNTRSHRIVEPKVAAGRLRVKKTKVEAELAQLEKMARQRFGDQVETLLAAG
jgi:hypothetical protein